MVNGFPNLFTITGPQSQRPTSPANRTPAWSTSAAADDAWAALEWVAAHAADHDVHPDDIVVAGDSAGGNLAAVTARHARDEGGPRLRGQILIYPVIDPAAQFPSAARAALIIAVVSGFVTRVGSPSRVG